MGTEDRSGSSKQLRIHRGITVDSEHNKHSDCHPGDISQSSKHLEILPELLGGSATSQHSETHPQVSARIGSNDHIDIHPEVIDENRSRYHFKLCSEVVDGSGSSNFSETHAADIYRIDSSKHMVMHPDTSSNDSDILFPTKKIRPPSSSSSSSSSSSASSSQDLFQVDTGLSKSRLRATTSSPKLEMDTQLALKDNENNVSSTNYSRSRELDSRSTDLNSPSQVSQVTNELVMPDFPPTQSPPIQVMERSGGYDPLRIPSAVFERSKSTTPLEWSAASNESLFSIHIGNNSFSRDSVLMLGGDPFKSGELIMLSPSNHVPVVGTEIFEFEKTVATGESDGSIKVEGRETTEGQSKEQAPPATVKWHSSSISNHSNDSAHSFAFPIKKKKSKKCACIPFFCCRKKCKRKKCAWPSCYCSNCSCTFCYSSWPDYYFSWPGYYFSWPSCYCSNCSWAFCCCWNCSKTRWCYHSSTILTDGARNISVKADVEKHQQTPLATKVTLKFDVCNWFSCFSCRPRSSCFCCSCCSRCSCSRCKCSRCSCCSRCC